MTRARAQQRTFLVTGGAGFIGSHLVEALLDRGHRVLAVDDLSTGSLENLDGVREHPSFRFAEASISDESCMNQLVSQADGVMHLAAAVGVELIVQNPVHTIETNVIGTDAVLRATRRHGCDLLITSSSEVYGKSRGAPLREGDDVLLGPTSKSRWAYAASKMVDECLALAYAQQYGLRVVVARLFNTVGPRQTGRYGMVIPRFLRQALRGEPITVYGDGSQSRCFCDVRDVVRALVELVGHPPAAGRVFNIGSTEEVSITELAQRVRTIAQSDSPIINVPYDEAYAPGFEDMQRRVPDTTCIRDLIGWQPTRSLNSILQTLLSSERGRSCPSE